MADGNTPAERIANIVASKAAIASAIAEKGVTVPASTELSEMANLIKAIPAGGGGKNEVSQVVCEGSRTVVTIAEGVSTLTTPFTGSSGNHDNLRIEFPSSVSGIGRYGEYNAYCLNGYMTLRFNGKTMEQVRAMAGFPWDLAGGGVENNVICDDGTIA